MHRITSDTPVEHLASNQPRAARVFDSLGIDPDSRGDLSLGELCQSRGLPLEAVLVMLEHVPIGEDARAMSAAPLSGLAAHIQNHHHEFLRTELPRLSMLLSRMVAVHGSRHPELERVRELFTLLGRDLRAHMSREERLLFPWIRELESHECPEESARWGLQGLVACLSHDHDDAVRGFEAIRELTDDFTPPDDACESLRGFFAGLAALHRDLRAHFAKERAILFPRAIALEASCPSTECPGTRKEPDHARDARRDT